ncbi:Alcohol dehydrogenase (EC [Halomonas sp. TD01]|nr:alcohol dehydrogenase [Halomonas sp. TD01]CAH1042732.1 Alcohol dehydrogenase (EC [Halomonas sp. TD01]
MLAENSTPAIPMSKVIAHELEILGSHGMQAHRYDAMLAMIQSGKLAPEKLIGKRITLEQSIDALMSMDKFEGAGVTVVPSFEITGFSITARSKLKGLGKTDANSIEGVELASTHDVWCAVGSLIASNLIGHPHAHLAHCHFHASGRYSRHTAHQRLRKRINLAGAAGRRLGDSDASRTGSRHW